MKFGYLLRLGLFLGLTLPLVFTPVVRADGDGSGMAIPSAPSQWDGYAVAEQDCQTFRSFYDGGKTPEGFKARATDGCHVYEWTSHVLQGPGKGTVKFRVTDKVNPWEGDLPSMAGGPAAYCAAAAAHAANLQWMFRFQAPLGTEVTVDYECK